MDSIISGIIGVAIFLLFVGGLAESIGAPPFIIIVVIVCAAALYGLYEDIKSEQSNKQE
ncbi:hypothetical protein L2D14_15850 [Thalassospiraceae bacterium LMO-JJ14]|nr:hypothetical protein L2D14_15850 [Thalassospiraceae bacterium LMO-JJ14]